MALIYLYSPLKQGESFTQNQLKITKLASGIIFTEKFNAIGTFEFSLPAADDFCSDAEENQIISVDNKYFGIIRQIKQSEQVNENIVIISGVDLKGYLEQRITLYPSTAIDKGLQGYDAIKDVSTETAVKYFINNNIVNPTNPKRKIISFKIAPDQKRGIENDKYMSRFEPLSDVCFKNLEPQQMGYKVDIDLINNFYTFDVCKGVDRTARQNENGRIIFDVSYKNIFSFEYDKSMRSFKNLFYASLTKSKTEAETLTCMYSREGEEEAESAFRYEQHLNVSVNLPEADMYANLKQYALKDAANYEKTETITAAVADKYRLAVDYNLGDFVTIQAHYGTFKKKTLAFDVQITGVTHKWTSSGHIVNELSFGRGKINRFEILERQIKNS